MLGKARWRRLLKEDDDFRRWYDNLEHGSVNTADLYARTLYRRSSLLDVTPVEMVEFAKEDRRGFEDDLLDFCHSSEEGGQGTRIP